MTLDSSHSHASVFATPAGASGEQGAGFLQVSNDNSVHSHRPKINCPPPVANRTAHGKALEKKPVARHWDMRFALMMIALVIIVNLSLTLLLGNGAKKPSPLVLTGEKKTPAGSSVSEPVSMISAQTAPPAPSPSALQQVPPPASTEVVSPIAPAIEQMPAVQALPVPAAPALEPSAGGPAPVAPPLSEVDRKRLLSIINQY